MWFTSDDRGGVEPLCAAINAVPHEHALHALGATTTSTLRVPHDHPIVEHELEVAQTGRAKMAKEKFHHHGSRWSCVFRSLNKVVRFVGVVSPDFKHRASTPAASRARR